jgi:hypothetical protein
LARVESAQVPQGGRESPLKQGSSWRSPLVWGDGEHKLLEWLPVAQLPGAHLEISHWDSTSRTLQIEPFPLFPSPPFPSRIFPYFPPSPLCPLGRHFDSPMHTIALGQEACMNISLAQLRPVPFRTKVSLPLASTRPLASAALPPLPIFCKNQIHSGSSIRWNLPRPRH